MIFKIPVSFCSKTNKLFIINFLPTQETHQLLKLVEDLPFHLIERFDYPEELFPEDVRIFHVESDANFDDAKREILNYVRIGIKPMIHIQGHGDRALGVRTASNTYISWQNWITFFESVAQESKGYLTVIAACCHSYQIRELVDDKNRNRELINRRKLLPYSFFYGFDCAIEAGVMWTELRVLYESLLKSGGKKLSIKELNIKLHCEMDRLEYVCHAIATCLDIGHRNISRRSIKKLVPPIGRASVQRKFVNELFNTGDFVFEVIDSLFWPTDLREELIKNIKESIEQLLKENAQEDHCNVGTQ